ILQKHIYILNSMKKVQIAAISTHRGTYLAKRLFFGLKTASSLFHAAIDPILDGLEGCVTYFDDIVIQGSTLRECTERLTKCLKQLEKFNIRLNKDKCKFFVREIKYLGYIISKNRLEKDLAKVEAVVNAPQPKNVND
ncbi:hypothetical protein ILUMI_14734, partial [Ignelater luminosus]